MKIEMNEEKCQNFVAALAAQGITDRKSLIEKGATCFKNDTLGFFKNVLGTNVSSISPETLEEIADKVGFAKFNKSYYIQKLPHKPVFKPVFMVIPSFYEELMPLSERQKLLFVDKIIEEGIRNIKDHRLSQIAEELGLLMPHPDYYRNILASHGITDRKSLLGKGSRWFKETAFEPFGRGPAFARQILGKSVRHITLRNLNEIADKLEMKEIDADDYREIFAKHSITDRASLLAKGVKWFNQTKGLEFSPFGGSKKFFKQVLGKFHGPIKAEHLGQVANKLGWFE